MKRFIITSAVLYVSILLSEATGLINLGWTVVLSPFWFIPSATVFLVVVILFVRLYNKVEHNDDENWPNNLA